MATEELISRVCETLGLSADRVRPPSGRDNLPNISIACPLAISTHSDPYDQNHGCSVQINPTGPSKALCFSGNCRYKGSFLRLVRLGVGLRGEASDEVKQMLEDLAAFEEVTVGGLLKQTKERAEALERMRATAEARRLFLADQDVWQESNYVHFWGKVPKNYLQKRGISIPSAKRWGLGYDEELGYLTFPVRRRDQKLVGIVGRSVKKDPKRKHHNYVGFDKGKYLFGTHLLETGKPIVIVEGCVDAIRVDQALYGEVCVLASLGEGFSQHHAKTIAACRPPFVCIFTDGDAAGRAMASKIHYGLTGVVPLKLMECPWGPEQLDGSRKKVDPAILPAGLIQHLYRNAKYIRDRVRWTEPPPVYDDSKAA